MQQPHFPTALMSVSTDGLIFVGLFILGLLPVPVFSSVYRACSRLSRLEIKTARISLQTPLRSLDGWPAMRLFQLSELFMSCLYRQPPNGEQNSMVYIRHQ